jgi:hypothetical protein
MLVVYCGDFEAALLLSAAAPFYTGVWPAAGSVGVAALAEKITAAADGKASPRAAQDLKKYL